MRTLKLKGDNQITIGDSSVLCFKTLCINNNRVLSVSYCVCVENFAYTNLFGTHNSATEVGSDNCTILETKKDEI